MKVYYCLHCGKETKRGHSKTNTYCGNICQSEYRWLHVTRKQIEEGQITYGSLASLVRYVTERDGYKCSSCGITDWLEKPLSLDLDHIDGNRKNNVASNLRLLCPNCHRQTPTWGNKKRD